RAASDRAAQHGWRLERGPCGSAKPAGLASIGGTCVSHVYGGWCRRIRRRTTSEMIRGIYTAAAGLATAQLRLGVVSNNVANAATPGYKQDRLPDEIGKAIDLQRYAVDPQGNPIGSITLGPQVGISELDLTAGPIQETSNPLDLAIAGSGYFATQASD